MAAKSSSVSPGKADDEIGGERKIGPRRAQPRDDVEIIGARVAAVHGSENAVGARLHRQMQLRHQLRQIAMRRDQIVVHVARMAGGVAQPLDAGDLPRRVASSRASDHGRPSGPSP